MSVRSASSGGGKNFLARILALIILSYVGVVSGPSWRGGNCGVVCGWLAFVFAHFAMCHIPFPFVVSAMNFLHASVLPLLSALFLAFVSCWYLLMFHGLRSVASLLAFLASWASASTSPVHAGLALPEGFAHGVCLLMASWIAFVIVLIFWSISSGVSGLGHSFIICLMCFLMFDQSAFFHCLLLLSSFWSVVVRISVQIG